jgi:AcrR family transcriptional regulator
MKATAPGATNGRSYNSPLRERQSEQTREAILEALTSELAEGGLHELNIPALARRAGVSVRTVYRYFPTRDALLDAADRWMDEAIVPGPPPASADEMPAAAERAFKEFDAKETAMLAQWASALGRDVRARGRRRRISAYRDALAEATSNLSRGDARAAHAVISHLLSSLTWKTMREEFGMKGAESGKAVAWALRTLIEDLRRRNESARQTNDELKSS